MKETDVLDVDVCQAEISDPDDDVAGREECLGLVMVPEE